MVSVAAALVWVSRMPCSPMTRLTSTIIGAAQEAVRRIASRRFATATSVTGERRAQGVSTRATAGTRRGERRLIATEAVMTMPRPSSSGISIPPVVAEK